MAIPENNNFFNIQIDQVFKIKLKVSLDESISLNVQEARYTAALK